MSSFSTQRAWKADLEKYYSLSREDVIKVDVAILVVSLNKYRKVGNLILLSHLFCLGDSCRSDFAISDVD